MLDVLELARAHQRDRVALKKRTMRSALRAWKQVDRNVIEESYRALLPQLLAVVVAAQQQAAEQANPYLEAMMAAQGIGLAPAGLLVPESLANIASDGRPLASLLLQPNIVVRTLLKRGEPLSRAMTAGQLSLLRIAATQVTDAGRIGDRVASVGRGASGYIRVLDPPSCSRCVILAGRVYRWSQGFERHPLCDCEHLPVGSAHVEDLRIDPAAYFDSLSKAEQDRVFGADDAEAIRLGADMNQIVNAHRGTRPAQLNGHDVQITLEGITRHGLYGQTDPGMAGIARLMPETIMEVSRDIDEAVRLLKRYGFIRDAAPRPRTRTN